MNDQARWAGYKDDGRDQFFSTCGAEIEKWQPFADGSTWEATETNYFGFSNPVIGLQGEIYYWYHPKLGTTTGGVMIYQGIKTHQLDALYLDYRTTLPLPKDNTDSDLPNGLRIKMIKPLDEFSLQFENKEQGVSFDVNLKGLIPPVVRYNGNHLVQPMKSTGVLKVRGKEYKIDGHHLRDRSWREPHRSEANLDFPPLGWQAGIFDEDFSFHFMTHEDAISRPELCDIYPVIKQGKHILWGYMRKAGRNRGIVELQYLSHRAADGITPTAFDVVIRDSDGDTHKIKGTVEANLPFVSWPNALSWLLLVRWECDGRVGYGNSQEVMWAKHYRQFHRDP